MKKLAAMVLTLVLMFSFVGCKDKAIPYEDNLGLDLSKTNHKSIEFNIYHSNTKDHKWELLKTFTASPKEGHFADVRVESKKNRVLIAFEDNYAEKTENTVSYYGDDIDKYKLNVDGFGGFIGLVKNFEVKDTEEEQLYQLYPIGKGDSGGAIFNDIRLDATYDENEKNLDNILITVKLK